ncbi:hypothetical protein SPRG_19607 [Saprolegnia parasitica CBS 223.65]|uniref:TAZ-type domain-containing protein n=1 Tax=Saprolegnia parasitica (strain CBS 223.65) TaxID=695850 RepID=A0A067CX26_SAPPC|nr:hypothetical protein SPRG_19607 [Saprolegnia parasitica CBS 223.65]KDO31086.1 hypothetical protein SPRG_19607 [Saprolegnia parasitica CBS 223.65]|eukprot:XP_012198339.1 hypothetical protein SPRG_19607 [Saprolegnia parasitica CBS 223.65]
MQRFLRSPPQYPTSPSDSEPNHSPLLRSLYYPTSYELLSPLSLNEPQPRYRKRSFHDLDDDISQDRRSAELAARLALLLHARRCFRDDCLVPNCATAKGVLEHCQECGIGLGKCHGSCNQAKVLLKHYRVCKATALPCQLCATLRKDHDWAIVE